MLGFLFHAYCKMWSITVEIRINITPTTNSKALFALSSSFFYSLIHDDHKLNVLYLYITSCMSAQGSNFDVDNFHDNKHFPSSFANSFNYNKNNFQKKKKLI